MVGEVADEEDSHPEGMASRNSPAQRKPLMTKSLILRVLDSFFELSCVKEGK